jgi:uncharacterized protein (TIGR00297 family)
LHGTGWIGGAVLAAFFVSSSLVSRLEAGAPPKQLDPKSARRDLWQVYANGGMAALGALLPADIALRMWLLTGSLAAAAADTWATSVGVTSKVPPRLLWSGRTVLAGTNGAVTLRGNLGAIVGALVVSASGAIGAGLPLLLPLGTLIGFAGMLVDSFLGAVFQGRFHCIQCDQASEWRTHRCGSPTVRTGGVTWLNNDAVNFLACSFAASASWIAWLLFSPAR